MFCTKCGKELPENCKFCDGCGEPIAPVEVAPVEAAPVEAAPVEAAPVEAAPVEAAPAVAPTFAPAAAVAPKTKPSIKKFIVPGIAVLVVIAIIIGIVSVIGSSGKDNAYVVLSDGSYELISNLKKGETIEIAENDSDSDYDSFAFFSEDGKYFFYFTEIEHDSDNTIGTLCRAEYDKLKDDTSKNDKYIEEIASDVMIYNFELLKDNSVLYIDNDYTLYHHTAKGEKVKIAKDVSRFVNDDKTVIYAEREEVESDDDYGYDSYEYTLYSASISSPDKEEKIDSGISGFQNLFDVNNIIYYKENDDNEYDDDYYLVGVGKKPVSLGKNLSYIDASYDEDGNFEQFVFVVENDTTVSPYDFVEDEYAEADSKLSEPKSEDFEEPYYYFDRLNSSYTSSNTYDGYYTSCTNEVTALQSNGWWTSYYSMEEAVDMTIDDEGKANEAIQDFVDAYGSKADDDGYIKVTDEIKTELNAIAKLISADYNWKDFCFGRYQSGTHTDWDAYYDACDEWYKVSDRIETRDALQDEDNNFALSDICVLKDGKITKKVENILNHRSYTNGVLYNTTDLITEKIDIADLDVYDVTYGYTKDQIFGFDYEAENMIYVCDAEKTITISEGVAADMNDAMTGDDDYSGDMYLYLTSTNLFMKDQENTLYVAKLNGNTTGDFTEIAEDVNTLRIAKDETVYYVADSDYDEDDYVSYGDLYKYAKEPVLIAEDIVSERFSIYEDGVIYVVTDVNKKGDFEISEVNSKGEATVIAEDVTGFIRVDEKQTFILSDDDLYNYTKKELALITENVDNIFVKENVDTIFGY